MNPKENRDRLFKFGKPEPRLMTETDRPWFHMAQDTFRRQGIPSMFPMTEFKKTSEDVAKFYAILNQLLLQFNYAQMFEDKNKWFEHGSGPIGVVLGFFDGWTLVPHVQWFPWASTRNKLRCFVAFLMKVQYSKDVGNVELRFPQKSVPMIEHVIKHYVPKINYVGKIRFARPTGCETVFAMRCKKKVLSHGH